MSENVSKNDSIPLGYKKCPYCAEIIRVKAKYCTYCHKYLKPNKTIYRDIRTATTERKMTSTEPTPNVQPKRRGCLTAWLITMLIANPLMGIYYFVAGSSAAQLLPNMPAWTIPLYGIICFANFIFAIAIWKWKKWGMYGFATSAGINFLIDATYDNIFTALFGLVGVGILALFLRQVWSHME